MVRIVLMLAVLFRLWRSIHSLRWISIGMVTLVVKGVVMIGIVEYDRFAVGAVANVDVEVAGILVDMDIVGLEVTS